MLKNLPNAITLIRIGTIPILIVLAVKKSQDAFAVLMIASLIGDILDGLLARWLNATSALGALLDSTADTLLLFTASFGAWVFFPDVIHDHLFALMLVPALWLLEAVAAILRYHRLSSFHTYLSRIAAYALGIFIGALFWFGFSAALMYLAVTVFVFATAEEFVLLWLLPQWTPDVRGAAWVLSQRRRRTAS